MALLQVQLIQSLTSHQTFSVHATWSDGIMTLAHLKED